MMPLKGLRPKRQKGNGINQSSAGGHVFMPDTFFLCKAKGPTFAASLPPDKKNDGKYYKPNTQAGNIYIGTMPAINRYMQK